MKYTALTLAAVASLGFGLFRQATVGVAGSTAEPYAVQSLGLTDTQYKKPVNNQLYTCGTLTVPAGTWRLSYRVMAFSSRPQSDTGTVSAFAQLTPNMQVPGRANFAQEMQTGGRVGGNSFRAIFTLSTQTVVTLYQDTTFTLGIYESEGNNWDSIQCLGGRSATIIRAEQIS